MTVSRRAALQAALAGAAVPPALASPRFGHGLEGQRKADLGNGTYLNPIVAGDHADPTV
ncbi:hypothetical protein J2X16_005183, partial [Pelomonas aquatica]|nr:hypothetical protein [Pelomonas aquatica]